MKPLDPFHIDLEKKILIEASAGTGKTYTITTLYCELAAAGYPVESILVVTFTEAAAAELKLRIRTRIHHTLAGLTEPPREEEGDLVRFFRASHNLSLVCQRLQLALTCFDQAAVMTIHSFCLKVLKENAFESRSLFDIELVTDRSLFLRQVSFDFFMGHVNSLDRLFLAYLGQEQITPERFAASFGPMVSRVDLVCTPPGAVFENIFDAYRTILAKIHNLLLTRSGEICSLILNHDGIDKRSYSKKNVPAWLEQSCLKLDQEGVNTLFKMTEKGDALYKFTRTRIEEKTRAGGMPPAHELFDLCQELVACHEVFARNLISLKVRFFSFFRSELEKMKKAQGICFFDDLVNDLAAALEKEDAATLKQAVRQTYTACLIDEFQDTDPRQYDIFSKIFSSPGTPFFMIGDPKQAIYAFRGGDIFAYLKASRESDERFTLEKNYRSAPLLVAGINRIFLNHPTPFGYEAIKFSAVTTPDSAKNSLVDGKTPVAPLQFCFVKREEQTCDKQGFIGKETALGIIPEIVATDILSLFQSGRQLILGKSAQKGPQRITPEDVAVLVRTNRQAEQIQKALAEINIPSYLSKTGSVFDSPQAIDLHDILWAVSNPDARGSIHAALCTSVFNFSSEDLLALDRDEALFFQWQDQFRQYREIWEEKGFVSMIMALFHSDEAFLKTNPSLDPRGLTNFYHLIELISQAGLKQLLSPYYLLKWYARQLSPDLREEFADELRLESDKKAVAIVTIHKSKGLEYPVVYLPYLWEGVRKPPGEDILFHDPQKDHCLTLDLGSPDLEQSRAHFETEETAEQRRLLYVAVTRASAMCRIIWGGFKSVETSALGSLLHPQGCKEDREMIRDLERLESEAPQSILLQSCPGDIKGSFMDRKETCPPELSARSLSREIRTAWKMTSFSALTHSSPPDAFPGREVSDESPGKPLVTLAHFPRGAGSGDLFHSIFETLDFTAGSGEIAAQVRSRSEMFGFLDLDMIQAGQAAVKEILTTSLVSGPSGFCLKDIPRDQRFNEMEFTFPVRKFQLSSVKKAFEQSDPKFKTQGYLDRLAQLTAPSFEGYMKGFIDLVIQHEGRWYILDYKSNFLGETYDRYSPAAMFDAMSEHHYFLQYHIYLVALHRYLSLRLKHYAYDRDFGGVFYLFIRGMHPDFGPGYGVFFDRPAKEVITELSENL